MGVMLGLLLKMDFILSHNVAGAVSCKGKSFEAMVSMVSKQAGNPEVDEADRQSCSFVTRQIISVSIKSGFRTRTDWDEYFAMKLFP